MHRRIVYLAIVFIFHFSSISVFGQIKTSIQGVVRDSLHKAIPLVTVYLSKKALKTHAFRTTYTDSKGNYNFTNIDTGKYFLFFTHIGYNEDSVSVQLEGEDIVMESISLQPHSGMMKGVHVTAIKPLVEETNDKIIYNVENDPVAKTEMAIDLLRKAPFVTVDGDNNIQVNGQSNFKILMNGRETGLFAHNPKEALKGFPGSLISKIEIITSPSSKYDAEVVGGIINIITHKKVIGYNGSLSVMATTLNGYNLSSSMNLKRGRLGITGFYNRNNNGIQRGHSSAITVPSVPSIYKKRAIEGERLSEFFNNFGNLEIGYDLDSFNTVSIYGTLGGGKSSSIYNQLIRTEYSSTQTGIHNFLQDTWLAFPSRSIGSDYIRKYAKHKEKEFSIRFNGNFSKNEGNNYSEQHGNSTTRYVENNTNSKNKEFTFQTDYIIPMKNNKKVEMGVKSILRRASSDFTSLIKYDASDKFQVDPGNSNIFSYNQKVYSLYSSVSFKLKAYNFRIGARLEHTVIDGRFISSNTVVEQHYDNLIPNLSVTRRWNPIYTSVFNYTMRLQRPTIKGLNPFVDNNDSLNIFHGNPHLDPQLVHSVTLQTRMNKGKTFAGLTFGGSYSSNLVQQYSSFNKHTGVTTGTFDNFGKEYQLSIAFNLNTTLNKNWTIMTNGLIRYNHIKSTFAGLPERKGVSGSLFINSAYKVTKKFTLSGSGGIIRSPYTLLGSGFFNGWYQMNTSYKFFNEKVSVNINFNNFFKKMRAMKFVADNNYARTVNLNSGPYRVIFFGVTWNFGKLKENVSKKKGVTNDDLIGSTN